MCKEVFDRLLAGDTEKQAALAMELSNATVHDYVKTIYRHFGVRSRAELLARCSRLNRRN